MVVCVGAFPPCIPGALRRVNDMAIRCCNGCVTPKRYPGCHDHCQEYAKDKAKHDAEKAVIDKNKAISGGIMGQKIAGINRAHRANKPRQSGWKRSR